jgi:hypothetical protein
MRSLFIILIATLYISCSVEKRIKYYSYTDEWSYYKQDRYQVYQTKFGKKYILILNDNKTRVKRKYLNLK